MSGAMTVERPTAVAAASEPAPSFIGLVRGEVLKLTRSWLTWLLLVIVAGPVVFLFLVAASADRFKLDLAHEPLVYYYQTGEAGLSVFRVFSGIALIILTARLIGIEYSGGTIRVLLSRGVGRVQLMAAKLVTLALLALVMLAGGVLLVYIGSFGVAHFLNSTDTTKALNDAYWSDMRLYVVTIAINMAVTILMAAGASAIGRGLTIGLSIALAFFPVDNIGGQLMGLATELTGSKFWVNLTGWWLGPNLNSMPRVALPERFGQQALSFGTPPQVTVDGGHTLVVAAVYAVVFLAITLGLTWYRDVTE
jgi:ABC-2 type transport system permease protein